MSILRRQNETVGFYLPGFFHISVSTEATELQYFTDKDKSVYFHEYIHFMQNITTGHGLLRMMFSFHQLCDLFSGIESCNTFDDCYNNYETIIKSSIERQNELKEFLYEEELPEIENENDYGEIASIKKSDNELYYKIVFENTNSHEKKLEYNFNSCVIEEGMAYILEKNVFPSESEDIPRFPYHVVREVSDHITSRPLTDVELIQLCDLSLQTTRPGIDFIENLVKISSGASINDLWNQDIAIIDIVTGQETHSYHPCTACHEIIRSEVFIEALNCAFGGEVRDNIRCYLFEICQKGSKFRYDKGMNLFSNLLQINRSTINNAVNSLHHMLGAPNTFRDSDGLYFGAFSEHQVGAPYLPILYTIIHRVFSEDNIIRCPYCSNCAQPEHKYNKVYNRNCTMNFLKNIEHTSVFCMSTALAHSMGLKKLC